MMMIEHYLEENDMSAQPMITEGMILYNPDTNKHWKWVSGRFHLEPEELVLLNDEYCHEALCDVGRDVSECFEADIDFPDELGEEGFLPGTFKVQITYLSPLME